MTVILPEIHDGELRGIEIPGDKTVTLTFETLEKQTLSLTLEAVEHFRCDNLLQGNIVFEIERLDDPSLIDLARVTGMEGVASEKGRDYLRDRQEAVHRGDLMLLKLQSSYGCSIDALCAAYRTQ
jgi:hypothetical protein